MHCTVSLCAMATAVCLAAEPGTCSILLPGQAMWALPLVPKLHPAAREAGQHVLPQAGDVDALSFTKGVGPCHHPQQREKPV